MSSLQLSSVQFFILKLILKFYLYSYLHFEYSLMRARLFLPLAKNLYSMKESADVEQDVDVLNDYT